MSKFQQPSAHFVPLAIVKSMTEGLSLPENYVLLAKLAEIAQFYQTQYEANLENTFPSALITHRPEENHQNLKSEVKVEYQQATPNTLNVSTKIEEETPEPSPRNDIKVKNEPILNCQSALKPKKQQNLNNLSDFVSELKFDAYYGRAVLEQFIGQDKAFITFYPSFAAQDEIREAELQEMAENFAKDGKIDKRASIKSSFVKNFSKLNGDHFANFVGSRYKIESLKKIFKDKSSCTKLSEYLDGTATIEGLSVKGFIRMYFEFIEEIDLKEIDKSKVGTKSLRTCYKLIFNYMKSIVKALREWNMYDRVNFVQIEKFWPTVEFSIKWEQDQ